VYKGVIVGAQMQSIGRRNQNWQIVALSPFTINHRGDQSSQHRAEQGRHQPSEDVTPERSRGDIGNESMRTVGPVRVFEGDGSLSQPARQITGARWNGSALGLAGGTNAHTELPFARYKPVLVVILFYSGISCGRKLKIFGVFRHRDRRPSKNGSFG
jgi:hypothetical protein